MVFLLSGQSLTAKDIGILIDRSRSVEQSNRDEAVELINGLLSGTIDPEIRRKWQLREEEVAVEDDPVQREMRKTELENLRQLFAGQAGKGLATGNFRLFLGAFGNLDTVKQLESQAWAEVSGPLGDKISAWAKTVDPGDNETHFELARATAAARLGSASEFYFFVVSDGVEDLVNWPVSSYLDARKIKDPASLAKGDFRDTAKAAILQANNLERIGGKTLVIGGKTYPGYNAQERGALAAFKKNFSERLLCRATLTGPELQAFFTANPERKVPVSVSIYSARPRATVTAKFTVPVGSHPGQPHPVSRASDAIAWTLSLPPGDQPENYALELFIRRPSDGVDVARKAVTGSSGSVFELFPDLPNGDYEIRLTASRSGVPPAVTSAFLTVKRDAPKLAFEGELADAGTRATARVFDPRRDRDILGYKIAWSWTGEAGEIGPPAKLERVLSFVDEGDDTRELKSVASLPPTEKAALLGRLLVGDESGNALPLGGTYKMTLKGTWPDGTVATPAEAWFILPPPHLLILGKSTAHDTEAEPRIVEKDDVVKIGNWMHSWTRYGFTYELDVFRKEGDDWIRLEGPATQWPLQLDASDSTTAVKVTAPISGTLKYRVTFGPEDEQSRELVECPEAVGYIKSGGLSVIPWMVGGLLVATVAFFGINLLRKK